MGYRSLDEYPRIDVCGPIGRPIPTRTGSGVTHLSDRTRRAAQRLTSVHERCSRRGGEPVAGMGRHRRLQVRAVGGAHVGRPLHVGQTIRVVRERYALDAYGIAGVPAVMVAVIITTAFVVWCLRMLMSVAPPSRLDMLRAQGRCWLVEPVRGGRRYRAMTWMYKPFSASWLWSLECSQRSGARVDGARYVVARSSGSWI